MLCLFTWLTKNRERHQSSLQFTAAWNSLEILIFDELYNDVFFRLNLQHLQSEAEERSGLNVSTINSTNILQLHGFVHNQLSCGGQNMHTLDLHQETERAKKTVDTKLKNHK